MSANGRSYAPEPGKIPGIPVNLGGHELIVPPLNLNLLQHFKDLLEHPAEGNSVDEFERSLPLVVAAIQRNYPDFTADDARALVDLGNFKPLLDAIVSSSGLVKAGEGAPASR